MLIGLSYDQGTAKYPWYADALRRAGERFGIPVEPVWLAGLGRDLDRELLDRIDGLVLTGGADVEPRRYGFDDPEGLCVHVLPARDEAELPIVDAMLERSLPTLAICRGMQFLNVVRGGTLIPDLPGHEIDDRLRHPVAIDPGSSLASIAGVTSGEASTSHHQAVDRLGEGLKVVARAPDGIVEAIEWIEPAGKPWLVAVQWHPERMDLAEPLSGSLYQALFTAVQTQARHP